MFRLFNIDSDGDVKLQDDTFLLIPELKTIYDNKKLGSKAIKWIVLFCDYNSPYRLLLSSKRKEEVSLDLYGKNKVKELECKEINDAIDKYKKLQYDPIYEQFIVYTKKIAEFNNYIDLMPINSDTAQELQKVMLGQEKLIEARETLKELILKKQDNKVMGGGDSSFIEDFLN